MSKWTCTIIQKTYYNCRSYRIADFRIDGKDITGNFSSLPIPFHSYNELFNEIKRQTGISILRRKDMIFEKLSDFEKIATIDATQERKDCRVTIKERISGWQPCFD